MTDSELLLAIYNDMKSMKKDVETLKEDVGTLKEGLTVVQEEVETVKRDVKHLKKGVIKLEAMDEAILDEVERVHEILDEHKSDKTVHTA